MGATTTYGLRYPAAGDPADVPTDMQELASDVEAAIVNAVASAVLPAGVILSYGGGTAPTGFRLCDGSAVSRTTYAALFAAIGTTFGPGDGSTTFNLPDLRDRVAVGASATKARGSTGGAATHTLSSAEMPAHDHGGATSAGTTGGGTTGGANTGGRSADHTHGGYTSNAGAHGHSTGWAYLSQYLTGSGNVGSAGTQGFNLRESNSISSVGDHSHSIQTYGESVDHVHFIAGLSIPGLYVPPLTIGQAGGGAAHNNLQPYVAVTHIIKT